MGCSGAANQHAVEWAKSVGQISGPNQCAKSVWLFAGQNGDGMREQVDDGRQALERPLG
jgi:hypothetical protein